MPDEDLQLTLDGEEVPLEQVPEPEEREPESSQIGPDDPWPEDFL